MSLAKLLTDYYSRMSALITLSSRPTEFWVSYMAMFQATKFWGDFLDTINLLLQLYSPIRPSWVFLFCFVLGKPHSLEQELLASLSTILNYQTSAIFLKAKHVLLIDLISTPPITFSLFQFICIMYYSLLCTMSNKSQCDLVCIFPGINCTFQLKTSHYAKR